MKHFITPAELQALDTPYVLLDARGYMTTPQGQSLYELGHIAGAFPVDLEQDLTGPLHPQIHGGRHPLPDVHQLAQRLASFGVSNDSTIIIYDHWISVAGRLWWLLRYMGLTNVKVLLGGVQAWVAAGYELVQTESVATPGTLIVQVQDHLLVEYDEARRLSDTKEKVLVDVRAPQRYVGHMEPLDPVAGHIPGAINLFYEDLFTMEGLASSEVTDALVAPLKGTDKDIVVYCGSGVTAPLEMLALAEAGIDTSLYLGSWSDWIAREDSPIAKGVETL